MQRLRIAFPSCELRWWNTRSLLCGVAQLDREVVHWQSWLRHFPWSQIIVSAANPNAASSFVLLHHFLTCSQLCLSFLGLAGCGDVVGLQVLRVGFHILLVVDFDDFGHYDLRLDDHFVLVLRSPRTPQLVEFQLVSRHVVIPFYLEVILRIS